MALSWSSRHQLVYAGSAGFVVLVILGLVAYRTFFAVAPTCFDGKQNGTETGIDCGGSCAAICKGDAHAPVVLWARALETSPGAYTAAAYIENPQGRTAGAYNVRYSFRLLDADNKLIIETPEQTMTIPPQETVPVILPNVQTGSGVPVRAFLQFLSDISWTKIPGSALPSVRIIDQTLAPDGTKLTATVVNDGTSDVVGLTVNAVLFDAQGTAQAASKSVVPRIPRGGRQSIVFTWPNANPDIVRAELIPTPALSH